jgi:hypothetical protein
MTTQPSVRRLGCACLLALACTAGCTAKAPPPATVAAAKPDKRARCESLARDTAPIARMTVGGLAGAAEGPMPSDEELTDLTREAYAAIVAECMTWPDRVVECYSALAIFDAECRQVLAEFNGEVTLPKDVPAGPPVAWSHEFAGDPDTVRIDDQGRVFAVVDDETSGESRIVALEGGEVRWSRTDAFAGALALEGGEVVTARRDELVALDPDSGAVRWSAALPPDRGELGDEHPHVRAFVRAEDRWAVVDAAGRFFSIAPAACKPDARKSCVRAFGRLADEQLEDDALLLALADGSLVLRADGAIDDDDGYRLLESVRRLDQDFDVLWQLVARESLDRVAPVPDGVAAVVDGELLVLDALECELGSAFASAPWSRQSPARESDEDECPECSSPKAACIRGRWPVEDVFGPPVAGPNGAVILNAGGSTHAFAAAGGWKAPTAAWGRAVVTEDLVLVTSIDGGTIALSALDHGGAHRFRSVVRDGVDDLYFSGDDVHLDRGGRMIVVGLERSIAVLELPASVARR